jgi:hypothetical protein
MTQYKFRECHKLKRLAVKIDVLDWKKKISIANTENLHTEGMLVFSRSRMPDRRFSGKLNLVVMTYLQS